MGKKIISPLQYKGMMNSQFFEEWFEKHLISKLTQGAVIVMDNASFHRKKHLYEMAQQHKMKIIFLPPYSPALNPIEHFWHWLKKKICDLLNFFVILMMFSLAFFKCFEYIKTLLLKCSTELLFMLMFTGRLQMKKSQSLSHGVPTAKVLAQLLATLIFLQWIGIPDSQLSGLHKFEGSNPAYWCEHGYAVCTPDTRGIFYDRFSRSSRWL